MPSRARFADRCIGGCDGDPKKECRQGPNVPEIHMSCWFGNPREFSNSGSFGPNSWRLLRGMAAVLLRIIHLQEKKLQILPVEGLTLSPPSRSKAPSLAERASA